MKVTHTYAILELSPAAYSEIREKLAAAGYSDQFQDDLIDMHGIAVTAESAAHPNSMGLQSSEPAKAVAGPVFSTNQKDAA